MDLPRNDIQINYKKSIIEKYVKHLRDEALYAYLFLNYSHRNIEEIILGINPKKSLGYESMAVVNSYNVNGSLKNIFSNITLEEAIDLVKDANGYEKIYLGLKDYQSQIYYSINEIEENKEYHITNFKEGKRQYKFVKTYERNPRIRKKAIEIHGTICQVCGFNFEEIYGEIGKNFIEIHHLVPVSVNEGINDVNPLTDIIVVCSNCHKMFHRRRNVVVSLEEMLEIINIYKEEL